MSSSFVRYVLLGALASVISLCLIVMLVERFHVSEALAGAIAIVLSLFLNFTSARWLVFRREVKVGIVKQFLSFVAVSGIMKLLEYGAYLAMIAFTPVHYTFAYIGALIISNLLKFEIYRRHIFQ